MSTVQTQWSKQLDMLKNAIEDKIGSLSLASCYTSYLTSLPLNVTLNIINESLFPCIIDKGFTVDINYKPLTGLFQRSLESCSFSSTPRSPSVDKSTGSESSLPPPPPSHATPHPVTLINDAPIIESTKELAHFLSTTLSTEKQLSHHVITGINAIQFLISVTIKKAWNRWPLLYDPENLVKQFITVDNEVIVILNTRNRYVHMCTLYIINNS